MPSRAGSSRSRAYAGSFSRTNARSRRRPAVGGGGGGGGAGRGGRGRARPPPPPAPPRPRPHGDPVIDGQRRERRRIAAEQRGRRRRPGARDRPRQLGRPQRDPAERVGRRRPEEVRRQLPVQEAAEGVRRRERPGRGAEREEPDPVDGLEREAERGRLPQRMREEVDRRVVGDHDGGVLGQRRQQPLAGAGRGLDVGVVEDPGARQAPAVLRHPVDDEALHPVGGPAVVDAERLEHHQREPEPRRPLDRAVEGEAVARAPRRGHPVHDPPAGRPRRDAVRAHAHRGHGALPRRQQPFAIEHGPSRMAAPWTSSRAWRSKTTRSSSP